MEEINNITDFIEKLEKLNLVQLKISKELLQKLAYKHITGEEVKL